MLYILCLGYYSGAAASSCDICPAGSYCSLTAATLCEPGSYSLDGDIACTNCSLGHCQTILKYFVCFVFLLHRIMLLIF